MEFKGTKEEKAKHYAENWEEITGLDWEDSIPVKVSELDYLAGYNQAIQDSKAPEILEFLQSIVSDYENGLIEDIEDLAIRSEQLIKEATEL